MFGTLLAERMKLRVRTCRTVQEAGAGPGVGLLEAAIAIHEGRSRIALVVEADNRGTARRRDPGRSPWWVDPVRPAARAIDAFADLLSSYSTSRGLTPEVRAAIPVSARRWGQHDPEAILREPITRDEILASPQVAGGLHRLECCLIGDWGGALVLAHSSLGAAGVGVAGIAEAHGPFHGALESFERDAGSHIAKAVGGAVEQASASIDDMDIIQVFDGFASCVPLMLETAGVWQRHEVVARIERGDLDPGRRPAINTNGGMLCHGNAHVRMFVEAVRQLRGQVGNERQVHGPRQALVVSAGGAFSSVVAATLSV